MYCLNCGEQLQGPFCGRCGQRVVPAYPTLREMAGDAWHEFSGWDGRFARTLRRLLRPGALTIEVLEGRRARYVSPLRLYLTASVVYFLVSAAVPSLRQPSVVRMPGEERPIDLTGPVSPQERAALLEKLDRDAPVWANAVIRPMVVDPQRVIARFRETLPRALFALVPVFAGIVAMFYRRRWFSQHLVFVLHLHAAMFVLLALAHLGNATRSRVVAGTIASLAMLGLAVYGLKAFRTVYRDSWGWTIVKSAGVASLYVVALLIAILVAYVWAVLL
jgi:Protein of unknown function (DUF3667)